MQRDGYNVDVQLPARVSGTSIGPLGDGAMRLPPVVWLPPRVSKALTRGGINMPMQPYSMTT